MLSDLTILTVITSVPLVFTAVNKTGNPCPNTAFLRLGQLLFTLSSFTDLTSHGTRPGSRWVEMQVRNRWSTRFIASPNVE